MNKLHRGRGETFKANSYSKAAAEIRSLDQPVEELGEEELKEIEGIGDAIASKIREYVETGEIQKIKELED